MPALHVQARCRTGSGNHIKVAAPRPGWEGTEEVHSTVIKTQAPQSHHAPQAGPWAREGQQWTQQAQVRDGAESLCSLHLEQRTWVVSQPGIAPVPCRG